MAIKDIKDAEGYTPSPVQEATPAVVAAASGDVPPPTPSASLAPKVTPVVPGEVLPPPADRTSVDNSGGGALAEGIGNALSGLVAALAPPEEAVVENTPDVNVAAVPPPSVAPPSGQVGGTGGGVVEVPMAPGAPAPAPAAGGAPSPAATPAAEPRPQSVLQSMAPEAFSNVQPLSAIPAPSSTTPAGQPNERGYVSQLPKLANPNAQAPDPTPATPPSAPPSRTMAAYVQERTTAKAAPGSFDEILTNYRADPTAFMANAGSIRDMSNEVGGTWNFGEMATPNALVIHHTAGGGDSAGVIQTFKERNFPAHFVVERDGTVVQVLGLNQKGQHTKPAQDGSGISNSNSWGVEVIARDDSDLTPAQVQTTIQLAKYLETKGLNPSRIVGHGKINDHKQATEGSTIVGLLSQINGGS